MRHLLCCWKLLRAVRTTDANSVRFTQTCLSSSGCRRCEPRFQNVKLVYKTGTSDCNRRDANRQKEYITNYTKKNTNYPIPTKAKSYSDIIAIEVPCWDREIISEER